MENKILDEIKIYYANYLDGEPILFSYSAYEIYTNLEILFSELKKDIKLYLELENENKIEYLNSFNKSIFNYYSEEKYTNSKYFNSLNKLTGKIQIENIFSPILKSQLFLARYTQADDKIYEEQSHFIDFVRNYFLNDLSLFIKDTEKKFSKTVEKIKIELIKDNRKNKNIKETEKIKWSGKKTHIGYFLGTLAINGFIEAPKHKNGEINFTGYAKLIKKNFDVDVDIDTLRKYLNPEDDKYQENKKTFDKAKSNIPNIIEVS